MCMIRKRQKTARCVFGFVSTGNLNERTARVYGDHCLLTSNHKILADVNRLFNYLGTTEDGAAFLKDCDTILPSPHIVRKKLFELIDDEIKQAMKSKPCGNIIKDELSVWRWYDQ